MSEIIDHLTYTVYVSRKNSAMDYGNGSSNEASAHVQVDVPLGTDPTGEAAQVALRNGFNAAKAQVAVTLGMTTTLDGEGTLQYDEVEPVASNKAFVQAAEKAFAPAAQAAPNVSADEPPYTNPERGSDGEKANVKWGRARFATHPDEFFDNRESKRNPAGPDVKHKKWNKNGGWDNDLVAWIN